MPQFDLSTAASQIFWLVVVFTLLYMVLWRLVLPRMAMVMETRQRKIDDDLARAERLKNEAAGVLADYEKTLAGARGEAGRLMKEAAEAAGREQAERLAAFGAELAQRTGEAEARIARAAAEAEGNLRAIAVEAAQQVAGKLLGQPVDKAAVERAVAAAAGRTGGGR
jgi:F-type H+-transporting ATPase subunit b